MDTERHRGKVVFITGGGSGIGRETALRFAQEGAERIYLVDHFADRIDAVAEEVAAAGAVPGKIVAELADVEDCRRAVREAYADAGRLDVVVSNAAAWSEESFLEQKIESWQKVVGVILTAGFIVGQEGARAMVDAGNGGSILYTASVSALGASPLFAPYCAAKAGLVCLMKTMAIELVGHGIRVNAISPGPSDTQQSVDLVGEEQMQKWREQGFPANPSSSSVSSSRAAGAAIGSSSPVSRTTTFAT